jgi:cytochrome c oxidase cbb3-type subunit III
MPLRTRRRHLLFRTLSLALLAIPSALLAQDRNPFAGDAKAAKAGEYEFRINCAFCHGLGARGGGRGPDLSKATKRHGATDAELFSTISNGVPGTVMPANGTNGQGVGMTDEEIWQIITYIHSIEVKAPVQPIGDPVRGRQLFEGDSNCSSCHMVNGKGRRLGPDLSDVATSRTSAALIESVRNPNARLAWGLTESTKEFAQEYRAVSLVTADGKKLKGVTLNEDQFSIQIIDFGQQVHSFDKSQLRSLTVTRESVMPVYDSTTLPDRDLNDLVAYLLSNGTK